MEGLNRKSIRILVWKNIVYINKNDLINLDFMKILDEIRHEAELEL